MVSSNSPKKRTNEFVFTTTTNLFVCFLGEFEDTKKSFRNYLTFRNLKIETWNNQSSKKFLEVFTLYFSNFYNFFQMPRWKYGTMQHYERTFAYWGLCGFGSKYFSPSTSKYFFFYFEYIEGAIKEFLWKLTCKVLRI